MFVTAEAAGVDSDRVIQHSDPDYRRDAEPLRGRIRHAGDRKYKPGNAYNQNQTEKGLGEGDILR
jgi:hypothetical protein